MLELGVSCRGPDRRPSFLEYLFDETISLDPNDLMIWALEVKKRSQIRKLMDACRRISNSFEQGFGLTELWMNLSRSSRT